MPDHTSIVAPPKIPPSITELTRKAEAVLGPPTQSTSADFNSLSLALAEFRDSLTSSPDKVVSTPLDNAHLVQGLIELATPETIDFATDIVRSERDKAVMRERHATSGLLSPDNLLVAYETTGRLFSVSESHVLEYKLDEQVLVRRALFLDDSNPAKELVIPLQGSSPRSTLLSRYGCSVAVNYHFHSGYRSFPVIDIYRENDSDGDSMKLSGRFQQYSDADYSLQGAFTEVEEGLILSRRIKPFFGSEFATLGFYTIGNILHRSARQPLCNGKLTFPSSARLTNMWTTPDTNWIVVELADQKEDSVSIHIFQKSLLKNTTLVEPSTWSSSVTLYSQSNSSHMQGKIPLAIAGKNPMTLIYTCPGRGYFEIDSITHDTGGIKVEYGVNFKTDRDYSAVALSPDASLVAFGNSEGDVRIYSIAGPQTREQPKLIGQCFVDGGSKHLSFNGDGSELTIHNKKALRRYAVNRGLS